MNSGAHTEGLRVPGSELAWVAEELRQVREQLAAILAKLDRPLGSAPGLVSLDRAAGLLAVSKSHVRRMVARGELATVAIGNLPRVPIKEIERLSTPLGSRPEVGQRAPSRAGISRGRGKLEAQRTRGALKAMQAKRRAEAMTEAQKIRALNKKR